MPETNKRVTLKDIAEKTGFTVNTVSRALRNHPDLSVKTKELIKDTADKMGFVQNEMAGSLRSGFTKTLALIVSDISNPMFGILTKEIVNRAQEHQYTVIIMNTDECEEREEQAVRAAIAKNVDGVLLVPTQYSLKCVGMLQRAGKPCVLVGRRFEGYLTDSMVFNDREGGRLATEYLLLKGRRHILMLNAPEHISSAHGRLIGYRDALSEQNIAENETVLTVEALGGIEEGLRSVMSRLKNIDAIFAFSDLIAFDTICVLQKMGLRVPEDISVVGFDDIQSRLSIPFPLTTVCTPKSEMAKLSVELLLKRISGDFTDYPLEKQFEVRLIIRGSV